MKEIPNYNGNYLISKEGNVYSIPKGRELKPCKSVRGYMVVNLNKKIRPIHQLVAESYIDAIYKDKGLVVDHLNRDKLDNSLSNLRLVSKSENFKNSDYYDNRKKGNIRLRSNGRFRVRLTNNDVKFDKTFKLKVDAECYLAGLQKHLENLNPK